MSSKWKTRAAGPPADSSANSGFVLLGSDGGFTTNWLYETPVGRSPGVGTGCRLLLCVLALVYAASGSSGQEVRKPREATRTRIVLPLPEPSRERAVQPKEWPRPQEAPPFDPGDIRSLRILRQLELRDGRMATLYGRKSDTVERDADWTEYTEDWWLLVDGRTVWSRTETSKRRKRGPYYPPVYNYYAKRDYELAEGTPSVLGLIYVHQSWARMIEIDLSEQTEQGRRDVSIPQSNKRNEQRNHVSERGFSFRTLHQDYYAIAGVMPCTYRIGVHGLQYYDGEWHLDVSVRGRHFHLALKSMQDEWRVLPCRYGATN